MRALISTAEIGCIAAESCLAEVIMSGRMPKVLLPHISPVRAKPQMTSSATNRMSYRSEEHTSELQSRLHLVCRLLLEKNKNSRLNVHAYFVAVCRQVAHLSAYHE